MGGDFEKVAVGDDLTLVEDDNLAGEFEDFGDGVLLFDSVSEDFIEIYQSLYGDHIFYIETETIDGVVHGQTVVNL